NDRRSLRFRKMPETEQRFFEGAFPLSAAASGESDGGADIPVCRARAFSADRNVCPTSCAAFDIDSRFAAEIERDIELAFDFLQQFGSDRDAQICRGVER